MPDWVHVEFSKWDGYRHWTYNAIRLGADEHGVWLGGPSGTVIDRPDAQVVLEFPSLVLVPAEGWWVAAFNADAAPEVRAPFDVYVDISTVPRLAGDTMTAVDLDLDVVRYWDGTIELLDEDEFAAHRAELGYPAEVVAGAWRGVAECRAALRAGREPYASAYLRWFDRLSAVPVR